MDAQTDQVRRRGRVWHFAGARFDEDLWQLTVRGERKRLEAKPMELLHELLLNRGRVVSKEQILDKIWPDVHVVEGSITTAIGKLRGALGDEKGDGRRIIETVPRVGYRIACEVSFSQNVDQDASRLSKPASIALARKSLPAGLVGIAVILVAALTGLLWADSIAPAITVEQVKTAVRRLDHSAIDRMLRSGWDPNIQLDKQGNTALMILLEVCEWNPSHDREEMVQLARTLVDAGAHPNRRNYWGDTAYSIAREPRFCGNDHPATIMLKAVCVNRKSGVDHCSADYEHSLAARNGGRAP